jgi:hypothetical protein
LVWLAFVKLNLLGFLCFTMLACSAKKADELASTQITAGTDLSFSGLYDTDLTVTWGAATAGAAATIEYKLVTALTEAELDTLAEAEALTGAAVKMDWATSVTVDLTGITAGTYNYYAVIARSGSSSVLYPPKARVQGKIIYKTVAEYNGNLGGLAGADAKCAASQPDGIDTTATVKALIVVDGWREACDDATCANSIDWVLSPAFDYYNIDGDQIGVMGASGVFTSYSAAVFPAGTAWQDTAYTGLDGNYWNITSTCNGWTSSSSGQMANGVGHSNLASALQFTANASMTCDTEAPLICVEQ